MKKDGKTARLGFWYGNSSFAWWMVPYWQQGGQLLSADGLTSTIDNEKMARAFALTLRLLDLQGGPNAINALKGEEPHQALFATGRCAMWTDGIDVIQSHEWVETFADMNLGVGYVSGSPRRIARSLSRRRRTHYARQLRIPRSCFSIP